MAPPPDKGPSETKVQDLRSPVVWRSGRLDEDTKGTGRSTSRSRIGRDTTLTLGRSGVAGREGGRRWTVTGET